MSTLHLSTQQPLRRMSMLEQSLDAIIGNDKKSHAPRRGGSRGPGSGKAMRGPANARSRQKFRRTPDMNSIQGLGKPNEIKIVNLHPDLTAEDLNRLMGTVGDVEKVEIKYNTHGQSIGVAFVEFKDPRAAKAAINQFDGRLAAGQVITVSTTMKLADRIGGSGNRGGYYGNEDNNRYVSTHNGGKNPGRVRKDRGTSKAAKSGKNAPRPRKTLEDLDKELNAYMGATEEPATEVLVETASAPVPAPVPAPVTAPAPVLAPAGDEEMREE